MNLKKTKKEIENQLNDLLYEAVSCKTYKRKKEVYLILEDIESNIYRKMKSLRNALNLLSKLEEQK